MVEYIPPEWGTASKQMREVERGVKNEFEFEIKGKWLPPSGRLERARPARPGPLPVAASRNL